MKQKSKKKKILKSHLKILKHKVNNSMYVPLLAGDGIGLIFC